MNELELTKRIMQKVKILQDYIDNYGEDDINEYLEKNGTYRGIEDYLKEKKGITKSYEETSNC
jgi:hypothetical protein